jgi:hypothetical protein
LPAPETPLLALAMKRPRPSTTKAPSLIPYFDAMCVKQFILLQFQENAGYGNQNAPRAKPLIFRPSAAEFPANRLRLLSCHRTVGLPALRQTYDKVRYSANDTHAAFKLGSE